MLKRVFFILVCLVFSTQFLFAQEDICPNKTLKKGIKAEGIINDIDCVDRCGIDIILNNDKVTLITYDEKLLEAVDDPVKKKAFIGEKISVEYNTEQFWHPDWEECLIDNTLISYKLLAASSNQAETQPQQPAQQVSSIQEGFRGIPWNLSINKAESYDLEHAPFINAGSLEVFLKSNENLSLGNVPLRRVKYYFFPVNINNTKSIRDLEYAFKAAGLVAEVGYAQPLYEECLKLFGKPKLETKTKVDWDIGKVNVKLSVEKTEVEVLIIYEVVTTQSGGTL